MIIFQNDEIIIWKDKFNLHEIDKAKLMCLFEHKLRAGNRWWEKSWVTHDKISFKKCAIIMQLFTMIL